MTSAIVNVFDAENNKFRARVLLDTCATANFVTSELVRKLRLPKHDYHISIDALDNLTTTVENMVSITFQSLYNQYKRTLPFLVVPCISSLVPNQVIPREKLKIPRNIRLADPNFHKPAPVDMLVNTGTTLSLFSIGSINLSEGDNELLLQKTKLGWIIGGNFNSTPDTKSSKKYTCYFIELQRSIEKFWRVEELSNRSNLTTEEIQCEEHFVKHVKRDEEGRYVVALPFKETPEILGQSKHTALKQLISLQRKFRANPDFQLQYAKVLAEYLESNHMSLIESPTDSGGFYMPHHAVVKESSSTTKLRVVFNASAKTSSGVSLNDILMVGPTIQDDLFTQIIRLRFYLYVLLADIEKMYRQFLVREEDRIYQKILWMIDGILKEFLLNTLTFGEASAAFLAIRCLIQLAIDEGHRFPIAARILREDMYVDNMMTGANSIDEAREIYRQMTQILSLAKLNMRQWATNEPRILEGVDERSLDDEFRINKDCVLKALGISWRAREDTFVYSISPPDVNERVTKRVILSEIAKLFDPLGLIGPVIIFAKQIMQSLWQTRVDWDESVPSSIHNDWRTFCDQIKSLEKLSIPRRVLINNAKGTQIHGFCDASKKGYGACLYVRSEDDHGSIQCSLLCAKSRVAPLKELTIPRLELNGAVLLVDLYEKVAPSIKIKVDSATFWTDSQIVLHWLYMKPSLLKTFVSNRISSIKEKTEVSQWKHVRSQDNPADKLSRGQLPHDFLKNEIWFHGPDWLSKKPSSWPESNFQPSLKSLPETKTVQCMQAQITERFFESYSTFMKMKRVVAWCYRVNPKYRSKGPLNLIDLNHAETVIIRLVQNSCFQKEINSLKTGKVVNKGSKLFSLDPFLDKDNVLRVGGRLRNSEISFQRRHPIILAKSNFLTKVIINHYHNEYAHAGVQATLYAIRQRFWPVDGRAQVRSVIRRCVTCFRAKPHMAEYKMGDLPAERVKASRPFLNVGIDYCGPFYIKEKKHRNKKMLKIYVSVFVCMATKAIHLETVSDLTSAGFLGALRRFIGRRGKPKTIFCDNATNFRGAKNELEELHKLIESQGFQKGVMEFSVGHGIEFKFIPPSSPHFGGLWEAGVKSFKHHFKRVAKNASFTGEEFNTLSIEIESILNSRPLTPMSSDINDSSVLTPGHFLIGDSLMSIPEPGYLALPANRLSAWQRVSKTKQDFWKRWNIEYLNELNIRKKWNECTESVREGMLVLIRMDDVPPMQWPLARIQKLHHGNDGIVRAVTLKTSKGEMKRTVRKVAVLPMYQGNE